MTKEQIASRIFIKDGNDFTSYSEKNARLLYDTFSISAKDLEIAKYAGIIQRKATGRHDNSRDNFACGFCFEYATNSGSKDSNHDVIETSGNSCIDCPLSGKFKENGDMFHGCAGINQMSPQEILSAIERVDVDE